ncbi:tRNA/tmRNA/rRNA uracil-C5-methylase (TrmA/RlmC/RlmD family) [Nocardia sp. GAS34]|uniref:class I SAM-dependent RNA methyltransferase n=1 Tax=unclassified Nocardia TaxID=2637762 RepID=UPI003D223596
MSGRDGESNWEGSVFEVRLGSPGHGGFCVARHEGRVLFVRHGLPGELVRARVSEDRGGSFCRAEAVEILEASPDRVPAICPVSGPGGAGCCDFSFATPAAQRALKATVVSEQLRRVAAWETDVVVEPIPGGEQDVGWRTRIRLVVDERGRAGVHRFRSTDIIADLRCPQPVSGALEGIADRIWTPGADLVVAVDGDGMRHVVEVAPALVEHERRQGNSRAGNDRRARRSGEHGRGGEYGGGGERGRGGEYGRGGARYSGAGRREALHRAGADRAGDRGSTAARRAAAHADRDERVIEGSGRAVQFVAGRRWEVSATGFWQAHRGAAQCYSDVVAEWADPSPGDRAWDLYCGAGVFAARLAEAVGPAGAVLGVESARPAVADGVAALRDLPWASLRADRVERWIAGESGGAAPDVVVLDPPRAGAGKAVVAALTAAVPARIVHIGCDPAAFARDISLYRAAGYAPTRLRAFDAFPGTHHVECLTLLEPVRS